MNDFSQGEYFLPSFSFREIPKGGLEMVKELDPFCRVQLLKFLPEYNDRGFLCIDRKFAVILRLFSL